MMDSRLRLWEHQAKLGWGIQSDPEFMSLANDCKRSYNSKLQHDENKIIHDRTLIIRFEDIALDQLEMAHKIYDFVGLPMNKEIESFLSERRRREVDQTSKLEQLNLFGTNKKKTAGNIKTLQKLTENDAQRIRELCQNYIDVFEYNDLER